MVQVTLRAKSVVRAFFLVLLALGASRPSAAQTLARWQAFAGYAPMNDVTDRETFTLGWVVGAAGHLNRWPSTSTASIRRLRPLEAT
jgi:hypothetical protein